MCFKYIHISRKYHTISEEKNTFKKRQVKKNQGTHKMDVNKLKKKKKKNHMNILRQVCVRHVSASTVLNLSEKYKCLPV